MTRTSDHRFTERAPTYIPTDEELDAWEAINRAADLVRAQPVRRGR
jgi:hypothetical protein